MAKESLSVRDSVELVPKDPAIFCGANDIKSMKSYMSEVMSSSVPSRKMIILQLLYYKILIEYLLYAQYITYIMFQYNTTSIMIFLN